MFCCLNASQIWMLSNFFELKDPQTHDDFHKVLSCVCFPFIFFFLQVLLPFFLFSLHFANLKFRALS